MKGLFQESTQVKGNLGKDAVVNSVNDKKDVINFSLAIDKSYNKKQDDGSYKKVERTKWISVSFFKNKGKADNLAQYLVKGQQVSLFGEYVTGKPYTDKEGNMKCDLVLIVQELEFVGTPKGSVKAAGEKVDTPLPAKEDLLGDEEDDLPF